MLLLEKLEFEVSSSDHNFLPQTSSWLRARLRKSSLGEHVPIMTGEMKTCLETVMAKCSIIQLLLVNEADFTFGHNLKESDPNDNVFWLLSY